MSVLYLSSLELIKQRLGRLDTILDDQLMMRAQSAEMELTRKGIALQDDVEDLMLLVDYTVWSYQSRDQSGGMPQWLSLRIRERFISQKGRVIT